MGKSSWLRSNYPDAEFVDLLNEKLFQTYLAEPEQFALRLNALPQNSLVIVDEVQRLPGLLNEVQRFMEAKNLRFILSGSSARKLRKAGINLLAGRAVRKELLPLVPEELGNDFDIEKVLTSGSLPLIWNRGGDRETLEAYVQTYLKEEVQAEALVRNLPAFARFLPVAALFHAQVLNVASLGRDAGVGRTTVLGYLGILEDTLLAFRLPAFEGKLRVKEKRHPKLYWVDSGIARAARKRFGEVRDEERGSLFEGWIAGLLRAYQSYRRLFDDWCYWAPTESENLEVDFLLWRDDQCIAIEAKCSTKFRSEHIKGLQALSRSWKDTTLKRCLVVYLGDQRLKTENGIEIMPLKEFLHEIEKGTLFP